MLQILITDMKSTVEAKVEHRLQVAFYGLMIEQILTDAGVSHEPIRTAILFRPPPDPDPEDEEALKPLRDAARAVFSLDGYLLEVVADPDAYARSVPSISCPFRRRFLLARVVHTVSGKAIKHSGW
jgi:hypothetical protein